MVCNPNRPGISQFHSRTITSPKTAAKTSTSTPITKTFPMRFPLNPCMFLSSSIRKLVIDFPQPLAQMQCRIPLAREQRIHAHARFRGQIFEAAAFEFVSDEHFTLLGGKLLQCVFKLVEEQTTGVSCVGRSLRGGKQLLQRRHFALLLDFR